MEIGEYFIIRLQCGRPFFSGKERLFFPDNVHMVRVGVGVGVRVTRVINSVSK